MKLQTGSKQGRELCSFLVNMFPARMAEIAKVNEKITMGVSLEFQATKATHTDEQRGYYWVSLHSLGKEIGYSPKETDEYLHKIMCCHAFGVLKEIRVELPDGSAAIMSIPKATSSHDETGAIRSRETYSKLIDTMLRIASEIYAVYLPPPKKETAA